MDIVKCPLNELLSHGVVIVDKMGLVVVGNSFLDLTKLMMRETKRRISGSLTWVDNQTLIV